VEIREPLESECDEVKRIHMRAFPTDLEARLVELLMANDKATISLVAATEGTVVGHVLLSPAACEGEGGNSIGSGLGPLAVLPEFQRHGIGAELVRAGIAACQRLDTPWIVVLGDPAYYGRLGFVPASRYGLTGEFAGDDAFQILIIDEQRRPATGGHVRYAAEFRQIVASLH
jgi:putative acetyltransferase